MLEIFDKSRKRIAIAENASGVEEERKINSLWYLTFSLPYNDAKMSIASPSTMSATTAASFIALCRSTQRSLRPVF